MRRPLAKVGYQALLAVGFRAQLKNLLLPKQIHGERGRNDKGELFVGWTVGVSGIVVKEKCVTDLIELDQFLADAFVRGNLPVVEVVDLPLDQRILGEEFHYAEGSTANDDDVHTAVGMALQDFEDFGGAADASDAFGEGQQHSKFGFVFEATLDHGFVTRLENVQGKFRAGQEDDVEWEKRNSVRPHGSQR